MRKLSLADMHCDTALEIFRTSESFIDNSFSVSLKKAELYEKYIQVCAVWSDSKLNNDEAFNQFFSVVDHLKNDLSSIASVSITPKHLSSPNNMILSVEDARILNGNISRLDDIFSVGVRILTLLWSGQTCIGGSFDTDIGLTDFGKKVVLRCTELGIIPDISHASVTSADDTFEICEGLSPVIASHSDAYSIYPHPRNLSDTAFQRIKNSGGLVGINLYTEHLGIEKFKNPTTAILNHIEHYLSLGGENTVCFGCDFDGATTPDGFKDISSISSLAEEMAKIGYSEKLIYNIFFENAKNFILKNILK